jgi:hypothetical protein
MDMTTHETATECRSTLNYLDGGLTPVTIHDGRTADLPGWEACGFELRHHASAIDDWSDDEVIERVHYPEMATLARELSGCDHVLVFGHIKRNPVKAAEHGDLAPITLVHSDFADSYGNVIRGRYTSPTPEAARSLEEAGLTARDVEQARRTLILQFWRNVGPAKMDLPLAFCDARTVPRSQIRAFPVTNYAGGGIDFDALGVVAPRRPSDHAWYWFDRMQPDEVVAFRTYDTDRIGTDEPYWTPHSAFRDPAVELGRPSRSSIELRATCLWF